MQYKIKLDALNGEEIEIITGFWSGKKQVFFRGMPLVRAKEKNKPFLLDWNGGQKKIYLRMLYPDMIRKIKIDDQEISVDNGFSTAEYVVACLPLLLISFGGALGGLIGGVASALNMKLLRVIRPVFLRVVASLAVTIMALILFLFCAGAFRAGLNKTEVSSLEKKAVANPQSLETQIELMKRYYASRMFDKQLEQSKKILKTHPEELTALAFEAMAYLETGQYTLAVMGAEKLARLRSEDYASLVLLGQSYGGAGQYDQAEAALNKAIQVNPQDFQAHFVLAMLYVSMQQKDKAMQQYEELKRLGKKSEAAQILGVIKRGKLDP